MKNIILFSRCELVHLYGRLSPYLAESNNIIHIAYSDEEGNKLKSVYSIDNFINFHLEIRTIFENEKPDPDLCNLIDKEIIEYTHGRFNLNSAIQSDRTFQYISYSNCLLLAQTYYKFWNNLISKENVNYLLHEPTSLFLNHIAAVVCKKHDAEYIAQIQVYGENKHNYLIVSGDEGICTEILGKKSNSALTNIDRERVSNFLLDLRKSDDVFFSEIAKRKHSFLHLVASSVKILSKSAKCRLNLMLHSFEPTEHLRLFFEIKGADISQIIRNWSSYFRKYDEYIQDVNYYYYPMHLEPEAVVLYWGDGIYKNQVKLIENIAAQLPSGCYLYVKDHPHAGAYRDALDYQRIKAVPNVRLLNPALSGKLIIKNAIGVFTINGTSGLEALFNNKQVYTLGNSYYNKCKRVNYIANIKDLREVIYTNFNNIYEDDETLFEFVNSYLDSVHEGFIDYFLNYPKVFGIDEEKNIETVYRGLRDYFL